MTWPRPFAEPRRIRWALEEKISKIRENKIRHGTNAARSEIERGVLSFGPVDGAIGESSGD